MSYFRGIAQMALGVGPHIEPRISSTFDDFIERSEEVPETESDATPINVVNATLVDVTNASETHLHPETRVEWNERVDGDTIHLRGETIRETERIERFDTVERVRETTLRESVARKETLRELLREVRETRSERLQPGETIAERAVPIPETIVERRTERERFVRESSHHTSQILDRTTLSRSEETLRQEPTIEIHIGRIEVKAAAPEAKPTRREERKPTGIISLDDYLRERSREGK